MRKKTIIISANLTNQVRIYLSHLGLLDTRTGKVRKGVNISGIVNQALIMFFHKKHGEQLEAVYVKRLIAEKNSEIDRLRREIKVLAEEAAAAVPNGNN